MSAEPQGPEILVNVSVRFPLTDRATLAKHLSDMLVAAVAVGGISTNVSIQNFDPDEDDPA